MYPSWGHKIIFMHVPTKLTGFPLCQLGPFLDNARTNAPMFDLDIPNADCNFHINIKLNKNIIKK